MTLLENCIWKFVASRGHLKQALNKQLTVLFKAEFHFRHNLHDIYSYYTVQTVSNKPQPINFAESNKLHWVGIVSWVECIGPTPARRDTVLNVVYLYDIRFEPTKWFLSCFRHISSFVSRCSFPYINLETSSKHSQVIWCSLNERMSAMGEYLARVL